MDFKVIDGGVTAAKGFKAAGMNARIKKKIWKRNGFHSWRSYRDDLVAWYYLNHDNTPRQIIDSTKHLLMGSMN